MDEEASFANLLAQSSTLPRPTWSPPRSATGGSGADPWANPFAESPTDAFSSPFAGQSSTYIPPFSAAGAGAAATAGADAPASPDLPRFDTSVSPYVQKLEEDVEAGVGTLPDPPSVIAAREQEAAAEAAAVLGQSRAFESFGSYPVPGDEGGFGQAAFEYRPPSPPLLDHRVPEPAVISAPAGSRRALPSDLIDEELLAASDPRESLKKAFVKSTPAPRQTNTPTAVESPSKAKTYVFKPAGKKDVSAPPAAKPGPAPQPAAAEKKAVEDKPAEPTVEHPPPREEPSSKPAQAETASSETSAPSQPEPAAPTPAAPKAVAPTSVPLPDSAAPTPTISRAHTPLAPPAPKPELSPTKSFSATPTRDRVAVSPLDAPSTAQGSDYGFKALSIGGSSTLPSAPLATGASGGWDTQQPATAATSTSSRFAGKGWGALDDEDDDGGDGLFGKGGPSAKPAAVTWNDETSIGGGWGAEEAYSAQTSSAKSPEPDPSTPSLGADYTDETQQTPQGQINGTPRTPGSKPRLRDQPVFTISVGDPTRVGDPVRGYTVYTVRTRTTSPHYARGEFSVLRRFSDWLWLFEALTTNNPGVIVPPVPDKHAFGRFQDTFIETRRMALQRCLTKITAHPVLQLDPDLRLFLESDQFAAESKSRRFDSPASEKQGLLAGWTGPKYVEQDEWFDSRRHFLDSLESQLKALSKSIEAASKARLEMAVAMGEFADSITALAESDLGSAMCAALARLADLARREKEQGEDGAKGDVVLLLNMSDEYVRFIGSVRLAFASRIKVWHMAQAQDKEVQRLRVAREKARQQGKLGDRVQQSLAEIAQAERKARDLFQEFDTVTKLSKSEFARFERARVEEFKRILEEHLEEGIRKQKELVEAWEEYHGIVLKMVQKSQAQREQLLHQQQQERAG